MEFSKRDIHTFGKSIDESQKILIISHRRPDPDTIGAALSLYVELNRQGKEVTVACRDTISMDNFFLPYVYVYEQDFGDIGSYDLVIAVDCGDSRITDYHKDMPDMWEKARYIINIDHHRTNDFFGDINFVHTKAASTTQILFFLFQNMKWKINKDVAVLMMAGLSFDTGHFKHDNTSVEVFEVAQALMEKGAKVDMISKNMYQKIPISTLKVWGRALSRVKINQHQVVSTVISEEDVNENKANIDELKGSELITYINSVPECRFSLLLSEKEGLVKGSLRTQRDDVDVAHIAHKFFGGGGHKKAAGFGIPGKIHVDSFERRRIKETTQ